MTEPRCQMCMETYEGSLLDRNGYVVYDMYYNAYSMKLGEYRKGVLGALPEPEMTVLIYLSM